MSGWSCAVAALTLQRHVNSIQTDVQADLGADHGVAEGLVGGVSGDLGLGPVAGEVEGCRQTDGKESCSNPTVIYQTSNDQIIKSKLTHGHRTDEQADNYPEHPEQPLKSREQGWEF